MAESPSEKTLRHIKLILSIFLGIAVLYLMRELSNLIVPLFFALFFAVLFQPLVHLFNRLVPTNVSVAITTILTMAVFFFIGFGLYNVVQALVENSDAILDSITSDVRPFINSYTEYIGVTLKPGQLRDSIAELLQTGSFWSASGSFLAA